MEKQKSNHMHLIRGYSFKQARRNLISELRHGNTDRGIQNFIIEEEVLWRCGQTVLSDLSISNASGPAL